MKLKLPTYKNSTPVIRMNDYEIKVEDIVAATLLGGLNLLLISERGEGKTQILYDTLYGIFGGKGTYIRTSPDMDIKDIYTALNLDKLREKIGSSKEILEITEKARNPFTAVDELNRAPPIVQNQLLNVLDGYIEVRGEKYYLGIPIEREKEFYHVGFATINLGDHRYRGTFGIDAAILDRFGLALDLDNYQPDVNDMIEILETKPRLGEPEIGDKTKEIIGGYREVRKRKIPFETLFTITYLRYGVDYISSEPHSQRKTHGIIEGAHESGDIQGIMFPISVRTAKQITQLYKALDYLTELYGCEKNENYYFQNTLEILKLVLPYSGCLKSEKVDSSYYGNPLLATEELIKKIKDKFESQRERIIITLKKKKEGALAQEDIEAFDGEWGFMKKFLSLIASE